MAQTPPKSAEPPRGASVARNAAIAAGKDLYRQRCAICHFSDSAARKIGAGMKGLYARGKFTDGTKVNDEQVIEWIDQGDDDMPGFADAVKPAQIRALLAYLKSL